VFHPVWTEDFPQVSRARFRVCRPKQWHWHCAEKDEHKIEENMRPAEFTSPAACLNRMTDYCGV
jgi:hypothetical protein